MAATQDKGELAGDMGDGVSNPDHPAQSNQSNNMDRFIQGIESMLDRKLQFMKQKLFDQFTNQGEGKKFRKPGLFLL